MQQASTAWIDRAVAQDVEPYRSPHPDWTGSAASRTSSEASRTAQGLVDTQAVEPFAAGVLQARGALSAPGTSGMNGLEPTAHAAQRLCR
ncbi:hypothetical protein WJX73_010657 [Symbiochloris irregularis]|uniref:Uncharacterized protein n=1 Tax=Symbiochloris irregularis TaxID=706552 RepID=A0AAW1PH07_9CHLO